MLEQSIRRNEPAGRHFKGRHNYRRHRQQLHRPVYSGAAYSDGEGAYSSEEEDAALPSVMAVGARHGSRRRRRMAPEPEHYYYDDGEEEEYAYDDEDDYRDAEEADMFAMDAGAEVPEAEEVDEVAEIPMKWSKSYFPFRKEVSLESAAKKNMIEIGLSLNAAAKAIAAKGAYLGDVHVTDLRHNGPVSFAVRAECKPGPSNAADIPLKAAKEFLPAHDDKVHAVLDKSRNNADERKSFEVRTAGAVYDTWLSRFPGWSAKNLKDNISPIKDSANVALSTDHPIAHYLHAMGHLDLETSGDSDSTLVDAGLVEDARAELEGQEASNPSFGDAERLRLVLLRAYGKPTSAGAPAMKDATEVVDGYIKEKRTQADVQSRLKAPIVISGKWAVSHGTPLTAEELDEIARTGTLAELSTDDTISVTGLAPDAYGA